MKKNIRRLSLNRETLHALETTQIQAVVGGLSADNTSCHCFINTGCNCTNICWGVARAARAPGSRRRRAAASVAHW